MLLSLSVVVNRMIITTELGVSIMLLQYQYEYPDNFNIYFSGLHHDPLGKAGSILPLPHTSMASGAAKPAIKQPGGGISGRSFITFVR